VSGIRRVIVGASGSPGSLQALRFAEELARAYDATLIPVLAWVPPGGDLAERRAPCGYLRRIWAEDAGQRLRDTLCAVWGAMPTGSSVQPVVERGEAGWVLVSTACCPGDLLVVGAGRRGALARVVSGKVSHYCVAHAHCPVLAVPPPALARELGHGLSGWLFWHRPLTADHVLRDRGKAAA
jgi:nucleotide-binding universal stress UspA family protein